MGSSCGHSKGTQALRTNWTGTLPVEDRSVGLAFNCGRKIVHHPGTRLRKSYSETLHYREH